MTENEKKILIARAAIFGVDVSFLDTRTLNTVKTILDYIDTEMARYQSMKAEIKSFNSRFSTTAIADATGLSRSNMSRNLVLRSLIKAAKPDLGTEVFIQRSEYEAMMAEIALNAEWHQASIVREIVAADMEAEIKRLKREIENEKACRAQQTTLITRLKEENNKLKEESNTITTIVVRPENSDL